MSGENKTDWVNNVKVTPIDITSWNRARKYARVTVSKDDITPDVSDGLKRKLCISEHSPIREVRFEIELTNIPVAIGQQFTRHQIATTAQPLMENVNPRDKEHFVQSQRPDRSNVNPRNTPCNYTFTANIQGLIDMSKKRLCVGAQKEAREIWQEVKSQVLKLDENVGRVMVPTCIYRGFCPEINSCGFDKTKIYREWLNEYRKI